MHHSSSVPHSTHSVMATKAPLDVPSPVARLVNVIVDPGAAFRGISTNAPWTLAFLVLVTLRFVSLFAFYRPAVTPLKLIGGIAFQIATVAPPVVLASLILWLVANVWRLEMSWASAVSVAVHTCFAYTLATVAIASVAGAILPASADVDLRNPPFTNPSALLSGSAGHVARAIVAELDIRSVYALVLVSLGLRAAAPAGSREAIARAVASVVTVRIAGVVGLQLLR
jgi:hypothetical protein